MCIKQLMAPRLFDANFLSRTAASAAAIHFLVSNLKLKNTLNTFFSFKFKAEKHHKYIF
jgi:hypothetical protein